MPTRYMFYRTLPLPCCMYPVTDDAETLYALVHCCCCIRYVRTICWCQYVTFLFVSRFTKMAAFHQTIRAPVDGSHVGCNGSRDISESSQCPTIMHVSRRDPLPGGPREQKKDEPGNRNPCMSEWFGLLFTKNVCSRV